MDMQKYYSQLIGAKIVGFKFEPDMLDDFSFPVFTVKLGDQLVEVALSQDAEGNGAGFAFIEEVK